MHEEEYAWGLFTMQSIGMCGAISCRVSHENAIENFIRIKYDMLSATAAADLRNLKVDPEDAKQNTIN